MKKKLIITVAIISLVACDNSGDNKEKKDTGEKVDSTIVVVNPSATSPEDTFAWVGLYAEWNRGPKGKVNGNYDTSRQIFIGCAVNTPVSVPLTNINLLATGSCNQEPSYGVLMMIKSKDSIRVSGSPLIRVDTGAGLKPVAVFHVGNIEKKIIIEPKTLDRITKNPRIRHSVFRRNQ